MTDQEPDEQPEQPDEQGVPQEPVRTGNPQVDAVLASLDALEGASVEEHVAAFERAHEQLRGALDAQPDQRPDA